MKFVADLLNTKGRDVWSVAPVTTVYEALEVMAEKNVGALVVVDDDKLVGIFSERDYARRLALHGKRSCPALSESPGGPWPLVRREPAPAPRGRIAGCQRFPRQWRRSHASCRPRECSR